MIGRGLELLGGLWVLAGLAVVSGFRFRGRYWSWRMHTALPGGGAPAGRWTRLRLGLEYARWAWRMRRLR